MRSAYETPEVLMEPRNFAIAAEFPNPWREADLQEYIVNKLQALGYKAESEVVCGGGRADIVTTWGCNVGEIAIIEVKKYLDRNTLHQASSQATCYKTSLPVRYPMRRKLYVMGLLTKEEKDQQGAFNTARYIEQQTQVKTIFMNCEPDWLPSRGDDAGRPLRDRKVKNNFNVSAFLVWLLRTAIVSLIPVGRKVASSARYTRYRKARMPKLSIPLLANINFPGWIAIIVVIFGIFVLPNLDNNSSKSQQSNYQEQLSK